MNLFIIYKFLIGLWIYWANGQPANRKEDEWFKEQWPAQPYAFGYEVRDYNGNEQYRKEMSDGDRVTGSYGYLGPDGLYRHVEYIADINGFRAKIRTSEPGTANDNPSNVQIESNPILVVSNTPPVSPLPNPGNTYGEIAPNPIGGQDFRRDGIRRPPDRPPINPNPNRSTYQTRPPISTVPSIPRIPDPPRQPSTETPPNRDRDRFDISRGSTPSIGQPIKPNYVDPSIRTSPIGSTRGRPNGPVSDPNGPNRVDYPDNVPDNIMPYRGANPKRPVADESPRDVPQFNDRRQGEVGSRAQPPIDNGDRRIVRPPYAVRVPTSQPPIRPSSPPYDRGYDRTDVRNRDQQPYDDNRDGNIRRTDDRRYQVPSNGGSTKGPVKDMGFIEATKGPISPYRPQNKFYDRPPDRQTFDDDNEYDDQFKRRQDDDRNIVVVNKPVFDNREIPRKVNGFVRSRYNTTRPETQTPDSRTGVKTIGTPKTLIRDSFNRTVNDSSFDANQGRRDSIDKGVRRPTKVFVTSGPISGSPDNRLTPIDADKRQPEFHDRQQHIDIDYDNKNSRDGQQLGLNGSKGQSDRDRPLPPTQREEPPPQNVRPYYGARRDSSRDSSVPKRPQSEGAITRPPVPAYGDRRIEQQHIQTLDEDTVQRDDEFPKEEQPVRSNGPQIYQPLRPNNRPDRQPLPPRRPPPDRPPRVQPQYKPRTQQPQDRGYEEQQIEVQPYQTQNSASITSPVNTIPTAYKPVDILEDEKPADNQNKPSHSTPLSPSSYIVTPFPVNETNIQIKPIIVNRPEVYTIDPELSQMEIPKFGTRLNTPQPVVQQVYQITEQTLTDNGVNQQNDYNYNNYENSDQNTDQNPNVNPNDNNPIDNSKQTDNIDSDQYYDYYEESTIDGQTQEVDSKDSPEGVIYSQTEVYNKNDEKLDYKSNNSLPIELTHKINANVMDWHEYDSNDSSGQTSDQK